MRNTLLLSTLMTGCWTHGKGGNDDPGTDDTATEGDTSTSTDDSVPADDTAVWPDGPATCTLKGTVAVQLYTVDDNGDIAFISYPDAYGSTVFPFGPVWVAGYTTDNGQNSVGEYLDTETIKYPSINGDSFELEITLAEAGPVRVYGMLDHNGDRVLANGEPDGNHPDAIRCTDGSVHNDVDVTIMSKVGMRGGSGNGGGGNGGWGNGGNGGWGGGGWGGGGWGGHGGFGSSGQGGSGPMGGGNGANGGNNGGNSGGGCPVEVSGYLDILQGYASGDAAAMLLDSDGNGPFALDIVAPSLSGTVASAAYELSTCDEGPASLIGVWDDDDNWLFDPTDTWGAYVTSPDVDGNPVLIAAGTDLLNHDIQVPLGTGESPWGVVPFVRVQGDLTVNGGVFDDLPSGTTIYVVGLRYRPDVDVDVAELLAEAYDLETYDWADLTGQTTAPFTLHLPAETVAYIWAYADHDGDQVLNEVGEAVAALGTEQGRLNTGTASTTGNKLQLQTP